EQRRDARERSRGERARGPRDHGPRRGAGRALQLPGARHLAVCRRAGCRLLADLVDLVRPGHILGNDPAGDRVHRLVLAAQERERRASGAGEAAMSGARAGPMNTDRESKPASVAAVRHGDALDVANLPSYGFGTRSLMWWGTAG